MYRRYKTHRDGHTKPYERKNHPQATCEKTKE